MNEATLLFLRRASTVGHWNIHDNDNDDTDTSDIPISQ